jgi:hypothetical protein
VRALLNFIAALAIAVSANGQSLPFYASQGAGGSTPPPSNTSFDDFESYSATSLNQGLVAFLKLDESSGNRTDATGNGFTAVPSASIPSNTGIINSGATNNAGATTTTRGLAIVNSIDVRAQTEPFSVVWWIYPVICNSGAGAISTLVSGGTKGFLCYVGASCQIHFYSTDNAGTATDQTVGGGNLTGSAWNQVVFTYDGSQIKGYLNGSTDGAHSLSGSGISKGFAALDISNYSDNSAGVPGTYDEFAYYNRALVASEVTLSYNSGAGTPYAAPTAANGLNGSGSALSVTTANFSGPYVTHQSFTGVYSTDDNANYSNGDSLNGLNGGTGWNGAYVAN